MGAIGWSFQSASLPSSSTGGSVNSHSFCTSTVLFLGSADTPKARHECHRWRPRYSCARRARLESTVVSTFIGFDFLLFILAEEIPIGRVSTEIAEIRSTDERSVLSPGLLLDLIRPEEASWAARVHRDALCFSEWQDACVQDMLSTMPRYAHR